jgi:hypothetical protein
MMIRPGDIVIMDTIGGGYSVPMTQIQGHTRDHLVDLTANTLVLVIAVKKNENLLDDVHETFVLDVKMMNFGWVWSTWLRCV